jgi:predicted nucleotidyltransferase component of viral defense system
LQRTVSSGLLVRLANSIYLYPKKEKELYGVKISGKPTLDEIARAIAKRDKARIVPTGVHALNLLNLSTQVPANVVYLTDGAARRVNIGNGKGILFKHTYQKRFADNGCVTRLIFTALRRKVSFKDGTSLSKCRNLIEWFSEDIDIAVNREYLGFSGELSKTQIKDKLRRAACSFVRKKLQFDLKKQLDTNGISPSDFSIKVNITPVSTIAPEIIEVEYQSLFDEIQYIKRKVIVEVGGRSMREPLQPVQLQSVVDEVFPYEDFTEKPFEAQVVVPQRTFIEKICLLHEEFAKPQEFIRTERMSRHLYDLVQIMDTKIADEALANKDLYNSVVEHRRIFVGLKGFDYSTLAPRTIKLVPPNSVIAQ